MTMDADPEVRRYLGPVDPDGHRAHVTRRIMDGVPDIWAVERLAEPGLVGLCSISPRPDGEGYPIEGRNQINWRLARAAWGQGLAVEAASAVLAYGLAGAATYGPLVAIIHPDNAPSIAVARRIGMRPVGEGHFYGGARILYGLAPDAQPVPGSPA